ncbi:DUF3137 domain-containing protein [Spiroplasma alleghenense]|uniref:DUF3137 domain-containing protein n=1 Tax=Spiroplasma alleghenense TaxID=216931 RepID=A0A345Z2Q8_9MOLU|nr:DUF3137 domain-containing protein [Spiroplasma alleghenense]AXK50887.1 hypothetical protein SALLE_v1c02110 [Spiroplasma alleghenense]
MEELKSGDLLKQIKEEVYSKFENYKLKNKKPNTKLSIALWIIPAILWPVGSVLWFFGLFLFQSILLPIGTAMVFISIPLFISAVIYTIVVNKNKSNYIKPFLEEFEISSYYKLEMKRLFGEYLSDLRIEKNFLTTVLKLGPFLYADDPKVKEVMTFSLEGQKFSYGVVTSRKLVRTRHGWRYWYFHQTFIVANFTKSFLESPTNMYFSRTPFLLLDDAKKIDFESPEFNDYANVFSSDQIFARKFITPKRMSNILEISKNNNRAKLEYLFFHKSALVGEVKTFKSYHFKYHSFTSLSNISKIDELVNQIYNKVTCEVSDLRDVLKFFQVMGLFPD